MAAGSPPDAIGGNIFREKSNQVLNRTAIERTWTLDASGRSTCLYNGFNALNQEAGIAMEEPNLDGTYSYVRTGESTATLELRSATGSSLTYHLQFSSDHRGIIVFDSVSAYSGTFELVDQASQQSLALSNSSLRGRVSPSESLIAGFVIPGERSREILVRVAGPALASLGVTGGWADPDFQIYDRNGPAVRAELHYSDWSKRSVTASPRAGFERIFSYLGAFPFSDGSKDAAEILRLAPGPYTVVAGVPAGDPGGETLIEIYLLP